MTRYQDLKELLIHMIEKEDDLTHYYDVAGRVVSDHKCQTILEMLRDNHLKNLEFIREINVGDFGADEWVKCAPEIELNGLLPEGELTFDTSVDEISKHILNFEIELRDFYAKITREIISRDVRDLFESLVKFKERQIFEIKSCISV